MTKRNARLQLPDGSFIEASIQQIEPDKWRPHGVRYRLAWVQKGKCRVLFDNHHGKRDHYHIDGEEKSYTFVSVEQLWADFRSLIGRLEDSNAR